MSKQIFRAKAMGDTIHFEATSQEDAQEQLTAMCGPIPSGMVSWAIVDSVPEGDEIAADMR